MFNHLLSSMPARTLSDCHKEILSPTLKKSRGESKRQASVLDKKWGARYQQAHPQAKSALGVPVDPLWASRPLIIDSPLLIWMNQWRAAHGSRTSSESLSADRAPQRGRDTVHFTTYRS